MTRPRDALRVYFALEFLLAMPGWVVVDLYLVRVLHLSPLELVLTGTAPQAAILLGEVPTGAVADLYGRKVSFVIGCCGMGLAMLLLGLASEAWEAIALWGVWGLAYTFTSGAWQAWITDEVGVENVGSVFLRGARLAFGGRLLGVVALVAIGAVSLRSAVIAGGALQLACGLACIVAMPETGFRRRARSERDHALRELRRTVAAAARFVRASRLVGLLVATQLFAGIGAEALDRLTEAHVIRDVGLPWGIDPVFWFGGISVVTVVFGFAAVGRVIRRVDRGGIPAVARMLVVFMAATIVAQLVFALGGSFGVVIAAFVAALLTRSLLAPLYDTWLNRQITDASVRATVLSISGQSKAVGQTAGGPAIGAIGNGFGIPAALAAGALLLLPALGLFVRALRHHGREPELAELPV